MPVGYCATCGKQVPDSVHFIADPCQCADWIKVYKEKGWTLETGTEKVLKERRNEMLLDIQMMLLMLHANVKKGTEGEELVLMWKKKYCKEEEE